MQYPPPFLKKDDSVFRSVFNLVEENAHMNQGLFSMASIKQQVLVGRLMIIFSRE